MWETITDFEPRTKYNFGVDVNFDWAAGSRGETGVHLTTAGWLLCEVAV